MQKTYSIHKAKIVAGTLLYVEYEEHVHETDDSAPVTYKHKMEGGAYIHEDLKAAFDNLRRHLIALCEMGKYADVENDEQEKARLKLDLYKVVSFVLSGEDDHRGVTLVGHKTLKRKKLLQLVASHTKFDLDKTDYEFAEDLYNAVMNASAEVISYITGEKKGVNPQAEFDYSKSSEKEMEEAVANA